MTLFETDSLIENRVVVAMSGGVDSSVAAALLVEQGYEVIGMMMRLWSEPGGVGMPGGIGMPGGVGTPAANRCCTPDQMADARRVADQLGIPFYVLDVKDQFRQTVVQSFIDQHEQGLTPNPCIACNRQIRFTYLLNQALALDAMYLATGHYARVRRENGRFQLLAGVDAHKDQSYVLHVLGQEKLAHALFPIGGYRKEAVRELARRFNLPVASKHDSQDLCFLSDGDYRRFLRDHGRQAPRPGPILAVDGSELGQHQGLPFYTIGQRKGLGLSAPEPLYVLRKDVARNALIVGSHAQLGSQVLTAAAVNWVSGEPPAAPIQAQVKIRYKATAVPATISVVETNRVRVQFEEPVFGITAGQGAVFYDGSVCLGGGIIANGMSLPMAAAG